MCDDVTWRTETASSRKLEVTDIRTASLPMREPSASTIPARRFTARARRLWMENENDTEAVKVGFTRQRREDQDRMRDKLKTKTNVTPHIYLYTILLYFILEVAQDIH